MAIFVQNHGLTPLEKCQFLDFLNFLCLYRKRHFPGLYCLKKTNLGKWSFFDQTHGLSPLEKCQLFDFLNFLFLQPRKAFFRFTISSKTFSWPILPKKKKLEKWPFQDQNHGHTPLEKCQFFDFLNFLFLQAKKGVFSFQNIVKEIFLDYIA